MLLSGAEISRVEDSIRRICSAFGAQRVDVFTITSSIIVTVYMDDFQAVTQSRRITARQRWFDLGKLDRFNALSRRICQEKLSAAQVEHELKQISALAPYSFGMQLLLYALISASFSVFFGGSSWDALASGLIGAVIKCIDTVTRRWELNPFLSALLCSVIGGFLALLAVKSGLGNSAEKISIGNIMLLIPGVALTNAIRDMFGGDTISGMLRFIEAVLLAMTVAFGFVLATTVG